MRIAIKSDHGRPMTGADYSRVATSRRVANPSILPTGVPVENDNVFAGDPSHAVPIELLGRRPAAEHRFMGQLEMDDPLFVVVIFQPHDGPLQPDAGFPPQHQGATGLSDPQLVGDPIRSLRESVTFFTQLHRELADLDDARET